MATTGRIITHDDTVSSDPHPVPDIWRPLATFGYEYGALPE